MEKTETKVCSGCGVEKPLRDYLFRKNRGIFYSKCKECTSKRKKQYHATNRIIILEKQREYHSKNREKVLEKQREYRSKNREKVLEKKREWRNNNKQKRQQYIDINREKIRQQQKQWYSINGKIIRNNPQRKIANCLRERIRNSIKMHYGNKAYKTTELLGCSVDECRKYLENKFLPGMTWDNQGEWHIDHIIPCALFDLTNPEEQLKCFHYTNLQPLWAEDNLSKKDKIQVLTSEGAFFV